MRNDVGCFCPPEQRANGGVWCIVHGTPYDAGATTGPMAPPVPLSSLPIDTRTPPMEGTA